MTLSTLYLGKYGTVGYKDHAGFVVSTVGGEQAKQQKAVIEVQWTCRQALSPNSEACVDPRSVCVLEGAIARACLFSMTR